MASKNVYQELAEAVREYPVIYDRSKKGHKDKELVKKCWVKVAKACGLDNDEEAVRLFNNLKRRYNKTRNEASDNGSGQVVSAYRKMKLDDMAYLSWLKPYIHLRKTKPVIPIISIPSPLSSIHASSEEDAMEEETKPELPTFSEEEEEEHTSPDIVKEIKCENLKEEILSESFEEKTTETPVCPKQPWQPPETTCNKEKWKEKRHKEIEGVSLTSEKRHKEIEGVSVTTKTPAKTWGQLNQESNCSNDAFGMYIACELKQLDWRQQRIAKNEIQNILFKIQMKKNDDL